MSDPVDATSNNAATPAVKGMNTAATGNGYGVYGHSTNWEGVRGESHAPVGGGVSGVALNPTGIGAGLYGESQGKGAGVWAKSANAEGVHAETNSATFGAVAGIQLNVAGTGAGLYGENRGKGHGVFGTSANWEGVHGETQSTIGGGVSGIALNPSGTGAGVYGESQGKGAGLWGKSANAEGVHGETHSSTFAAIAGIQLNPDGTGAGIYGESRGKGPAGFFKGDVSVTGDVLLQGADCAEDFDLQSTTEAPPGTVMIINEAGRLEPSRQGYDRRVAGVVSGAGSFRPGITLDRRIGDETASRCTVALVGKVACMADAASGPIQVGDLLTSSDRPGYAMRADDPARAFGAVIGKALTALPEGTGLVSILVALQ